MDIRIEIRKVLKEMFFKEYEEEYDDVEYAEDEYYDDESKRQYYTPTISDDIKERSNRYPGYNVVWYGAPGQMISVHKSQVEGMWGNIYEPDKQRYLAKLLRDYPEKVELECSYGFGTVIEFTEIKEEQEAMATDSFATDFDGKSKAASTGSEELDYYVGNDVTNMDFFSDANSEAMEFFQNHKFDVIYEQNTPETLKNSFILNPTQEDIEALGIFLNFEIQLKNAQDNKKGDFNKFMVQLRDGHHRVMGAIDAGEEYVCLNLVEEDIERFKGRYQMV